MAFRRALTKSLHGHKHRARSPSLDGLSEDIPTSSISQIFTDVALYKQAITNPEREDFEKVSGNQTLQDFADLVGRDLETPEKAVARQFAQFSAESQDHDLQVLTEEPEPIESEESSLTESSSISDHSQPESSSEVGASSSTGFDSSEFGSSESEVSKLTSKEVVALLEDEFGQLAPEGTEELLHELDAALIQDVVVLGVVHITTHRLTFHASLPASRPDLFPVDKPIKVGLGVIHRRGLLRKRRVWLELSNDFLCAFPSAHEDDHIKPWRSILLSSIKKVYKEKESTKEQPKEPKVLRVQVFGKAEDVCFEFDTIESTRDWRRELTGAVYLYRRSLLSSLRTNQEDTDAVRISIPLPRVDRHSIDKYSDVLRLVSLYVSGVGIWSSEPQEGDTPSPFAHQSSDYLDSQLVQFGISTSEEPWVALFDMIEKSKAQPPSGDATEAGRRVIVDCGSLGLNAAPDGNFLLSPPARSRQQGTETVDRVKAQTVCDKLGIPYDPDVWIAQARLQGTIVSSGHLVVSSQFIGFWSKSLALSNAQYRVQTNAIISVTVSDPKIKSFNHGMKLAITGHPSLRFLFRSEETRDEAMKQVQQVLTPNPQLSPLPSPASATRPDAMVRTPSRHSSTNILSPISRSINNPTRARVDLTPDQMLRLPKAINLPPELLMRVKPMHFACLTIGSRGDVQPHIALGLGLKKEGHRVTIVTHEEYKAWIEGFGIEHQIAGGDPGMLMKLSVDNKMFSPHFFRESIANYRKWLDNLLVEAWEGCQGADILLESPYAMAGVHVAEALKIPYFRVCTMPWTKTTQFPQPFISPPVETPHFNSMSYVLFDNVFWAATSGQINKWRREILKIENTDMSHLAQSKIPVMYNFSQSVVPKPLDWNDTTIETGYWFLDNSEIGWTPPETLTAFMTQARLDNKPIVYIGFGSITVPDPTAVTERIVQAVLKSDVRAIISKGWSSRMSKGDEKDVEIPPECYVVDKIPHDWLFPKIDAALHHGGAGTTSASLRAGIPTLIKPWFGDQFFWASRVHKLGAGMRVASLRVSDLSAALTKATHDRIMREKAQIAGEKIRSEDGVKNALRFIYMYMNKAIRAIPEAEKEKEEEKGLCVVGAALSSLKLSPGPKEKSSS